MVKATKIKVKSIENEEIMTMAIIKTIITKMIITMMRMRIKIGNWHFVLKLIFCP